MLTLVIYLIVLIVVIFLLVKVIDKFVTPKNRLLFSIFFGIISIILGYLIFSSVMKPIQFEKEKERRYENAVKLMLDIKKTQLGYKSINGKFADSFDELTKFVENQKFAIISRKDTAVIDQAKNAAFGISVGADGVGGFFKDVVLIDTLGYVSVKDSLFKNSDRYKNLKELKIKDMVIPVEMKTGTVSRNDNNISVFQAIIDKNKILQGLDEDLIRQENEKESIDEINGDKIILGSLEDVTITGNWPKKYGKND